MANLFDTTTASSGNLFSGNLFDAPQKINNADLTTVQGLTSLANQTGFSKEAADITDAGAPRLSFLQRLSTGLSSFNPAEAILTGTEKGFGAGVGEYFKDIFTGISSAVTGRDYQPQRRMFSDVVDKLGVQNSVAKFGLGVLGDILLDPSTYFGGAIAEGVVKAAGIGGKVALEGISKVAPEVGANLKVSAQAAQDAFGAAFKYGFKSQKGATQDVLKFMSKKSQALLGVAGSNLDRLGAGVLSDTQRLELATKMAAGKIAEFNAREAGLSAGDIAAAARKAATSEDPIVQKTINEQILRTQKFAEQAGLQNPYEVYFPFIRKDKMDAFLKEIQSKGIKVGSEAYKKEFKNILTLDNIELDPAVAFNTRESQIVRDNMTRDFLNGFVEKYGKPLDSFKSLDEARAAGFDVIREKGTIFGKEIGYLPKWDAKLIKDSLNPEFHTINMLAKATGFDAITSLFKRSVTGLFPPFHIRNYVSGIIQNFERVGIESLNPKNITIGQRIAYAAAKGIDGEGLVNLGGKTYKLKDLTRKFSDLFSGDTFYTNDFNYALKNGSELRSAQKLFSKARIKTTLKTAGLSQEAIPFKAERTVGQFIEHQQKATAMVASLAKGNSIENALLDASAAGFDYRALTAFESNIMRRLVPFYSFTRKNIELQLQTLGTNPQRINQVLAVVKNFGQAPTPEEKKSLPDYIKESLAIKLKDKEGLSQFLVGFGTPIEQFANLFKGSSAPTLQKKFEGFILGQISTMNPILKTPIELGIGKDSFRQQDLKDVYDAREYKLLPQPVKDLLRIHEVTKDVLQKQPNGKLKKVGTRTQYIADPSRLLIARSLFTSRGVYYLDQVFGGDYTGLTRVLKTVTGLKPQQVDMSVQESLDNRDKVRQLQDLLTREGVVRSFSRVYQP